MRKVAAYKAYPLTLAASESRFSAAFEIVAIRPKLMRKQMNDLRPRFTWTFQRMIIGDTVKQRSTTMVKPDWTYAQI